MPIVELNTVAGFLAHRFPLASLEAISIAFLRTGESYGLIDIKPSHGLTSSLSLKYYFIGFTSFKFWL